jgi:uncharacterized membrane protein YvlD (DUF360 family)
MLYFLVTALSFYVVAYLVPDVRVGPVPSAVVKSLLFVVLHVVTHKLLKARK